MFPQQLKTFGKEATNNNFAILYGYVEQRLQNWRMMLQTFCMKCESGYTPSLDLSVCLSCPSSASSGCLECNYIYTINLKYRIYEYTDSGAAEDPNW